MPKEEVSATEARVSELQSSIASVGASMHALSQEITVINQALNQLLQKTVVPMPSTSKISKQHLL